MNLSESDRIVTAYAERAKGPGLSHTPIWVVVYNNNDSEYRLECIQPSIENGCFNESIWALYDISEATHKSMVDALKQMVYLRNLVEKKLKDKQHEIP